MAKLVLFLPDGTTLDAPLTRERTTIGRRAGNDICLPNLAVSGEHAVVVTILGDSFLEDMNSTNGTLVNGESVTKHFLRDRDEIEIGRHKLIYCVDDDAEPASKKLQGTARVQERDSGARVETAKPFVKGQGKKDAAAAPADPEPRAREARDAAAPERHPRGSGDPAASGGRSPIATAPVSGARRQPAAGAQARSHVEPLIEPPEPPAEDPHAATMPLPATRLHGPGLKLLTGWRAGTAIALSKAQTTLGRPGVQVAAIVQLDGRFRVKPVEGIAPPSLNGQPIGAEGADLSPGDIIDVAGGRVEFVS